MFPILTVLSVSIIKNNNRFMLIKSVLYNPLHLVNFHKFTELNLNAQVHKACHNFCPVWPTATVYISPESILYTECACISVHPH